MERVHDENEKNGNTTTTVFGNELHRYSISDGIRDGNVLGFDPKMIQTFTNSAIREAIGLIKANATSKNEAMSDPVKREKFLKIRNLPMVGHDEIKNGKKIHVDGVENYINKNL